MAEGIKCVGGGGGGRWGGVVRGHISARSNGSIVSSYKNGSINIFALANQSLVCRLFLVDQFTSIQVRFFVVTGLQAGV